MEYLGEDGEELPSEIVAGRLFLGAHWHGRQAGAKGSRLRATHVLNVSDNLVLRPGLAASGALSAWVPIADDGSDDVFGPGGAWWRCRLFLREAFAHPDSRVLVHCALGVNRSATVVAAWLMETHRWTAGEALRYLEERRPVVCPVSGHLRQLGALQRLLGIPDGSTKPRPSWAARRLQLWAAASLLACLACWFMAAHRPTFHGHWRPESCRVLATGVDSVGSCKNGERGNSTACSPFRWCTREGGSCKGEGTVRYAAIGRGALDEKVIDRPVSRNMECSDTGFGRGPTATGDRACFCRPSNASAALVAASSDDSFGAAAAPVPERVARRPPAGGGCHAAYLPWVLVAFAGSEAVEEVYCAYQHGLPALSLVDSPTGAASVLAGINSGQLRQCIVAVGQQGGRCAVALAPRGGERGQAEDMERAEWEKASLRYRRSWFIVGLGFFAVSLPAVQRLLAHEGSDQDERGRPLLEC